MDAKIWFYLECMYLPKLKREATVYASTFDCNYCLCLPGGRVLRTFIGAWHLRMHELHADIKFSIFDSITSRITHFNHAHLVKRMRTVFQHAMIVWPGPCLLVCLVIFTAMFQCGYVYTRVATKSVRAFEKKNI